MISKSLRNLTIKYCFMKYRWFKIKLFLCFFSSDFIPFIMYIQRKEYLTSLLSFQYSYIEIIVIIGYWKADIMVQIPTFFQSDISEFTENKFSSHWKQFITTFYKYTITGYQRTKTNIWHMINMILSAHI